MPEDLSSTLSTAKEKKKKKPIKSKIRKKKWADEESAKEQKE